MKNQRKKLSLTVKISIGLILGVLANTFFPDALQIGSFTTALFKSGANCLIGLLFFCSGAQIQFKSAGMSLYKGVVINLGKVLTGVACGVILAVSKSNFNL